MRISACVSQDVATRSAALHGLSVFTHLLQLSVDKTMLLHFAEVHEFNTRRLKRMKTSQKPGSRMRDITLRHKNANFSFKAIRQLIVLLSSVRSSVERTVKTSDVNAVGQITSSSLGYPTRHFPRES